MSAHEPGGLPRVLVDTSAYFAFINVRESNYPHAQAVGRRLAALRSQLYTTNFVVAETHALLLTRLGRHIALRFLQEIDTSTTLTVRVDEADEQRARAIIRQYADKSFSLTDATSFAVMERLRIDAAFTFDRNFAQYGLRIVRAD
jgi:predicted nucleic acid-binding protein